MRFTDPEVRLARIILWLASFAFCGILWAVGGWPLLLGITVGFVGFFALLWAIIVLCWAS